MANIQPSQVNLELEKISMACIGKNIHGTDPPAPLQLPGLPWPLGLGCSWTCGSSSRAFGEGGQQRLQDRPAVPAPPQQAQGARLSLQPLQQSPSRGAGRSRGEPGAARGQPGPLSPLSPRTWPGQADLREQPLISSRMSPASTTSSTSAWLSGSTLVAKTRPSTYLRVQPSLNSAPGTLPGSPFVPSIHRMQGKATSWAADTGKAELMGRKAPRTAPVLSAGYLFPFLGHFQGCADQIPLQSGEEDQEFLPEHHPQRSARDCLIRTAHLKESGW